MKVYQLGHGVIPGDAVVSQMFEIDRRLRTWGFETEIFAQHIAPGFSKLAHSDTEFHSRLGNAEDLLIYHYSVYTPNVKLFQAFQGRKILIYHNITPGHFFRKWDRHQEFLCEMGRRVLPTLISCDLGVGDSDYNRQELIEAGFAPERTGVLPIFLNVENFTSVRTDKALLKRLRGKGTVNFLSVGRIVPNKAVEDVIRAFYIYHRYINPDSRLFLVGSRYLPTYEAQIEALVRFLGLAEVATLTGKVSLSELKTYYEGADLYLTTSYHEGFCVPLIESMHFGLPVLARCAGAIPETLGNAGVLFTRLGYAEVAEMAHRLVTDSVLRAQVLRTQHERLQDFAPERVEQQLREVLRRVGMTFPM
ncbi:MAG: glycosyltransferase family 4 protein [Anaerolineales bacterium]|nr:glycosyltransferase family 4 protein [Anaerolineales bacterium]